MKYALLALGLFLLLMGGYSVYTGAEIIEVERGWSSVIAGTTAVVGGVLAFGLAWIIRNLEQLRAAIETCEIGTSAKSTLPAAPEAFMNAPDLPVAPLSSSLSSPLPWPPHTSAAAAPAAQDEAFDELALSHAEPRPHEEAFEEAFEEEAYDSFRSAVAEQPQTPLERPAAAEQTKASPSIKELWRRVAREIDATGTAAGFGQQKEPPVERPPIGAEAPAPAASVPAPAAAAGAALAAEEAAEDGGDWLDHALADLDSVIGQAPSVAQPTGAHLEAAEPEWHRNEPLTDGHMEEAAPPLAPEPAPAELRSEPAAAPAVIGHYEAEGTHYIMFADGSIEAQSERGIARFNSMADLKAYFETQEAQ